MKRPDFTAKADATCGPGNTAIAAVAKPAGAEVGTAAGTATRTIDGQVAALRALEAPGGKDEPLVEGVIDAIAAGSGPSAPSRTRREERRRGHGQGGNELRGKADGAAAPGPGLRSGPVRHRAQARCGPLFEATKSVVKTSYVATAEGLCRDALRRTSAVAAPEAPWRRPAATSTPAA